MDVRFGRGHRGLTRPALALFAALSLLTSLVLGGHRYFYCALMGEVSLDACCEPASGSVGSGDSAGSASTDGPSVGQSACCTTEHFAPAAPGFQAHPELTLHAPLLAMVPIEPPCVEPRRPAVRALAREARAGPASPDPREHLLLLMSFLT